jgi:hypothetical protein
VSQTADVSFGLRNTLVEQGGELAIRHQQHIPDDLLQSLHSERLAKMHVRAGELNHVASVPEAVFDIWIRQGRDPYNASARDIVAWLRKDGLDAFVTANV